MRFTGAEIARKAADAIASCYIRSARRRTAIRLWGRLTAPPSSPALPSPVPSGATRHTGSYQRVLRWPLAIFDTPPRAEYLSVALSVAVSVESSRCCGCRRMRRPPVARNETGCRARMRIRWVSETGLSRARTGFGTHQHICEYSNARSGAHRGEAMSARR